MSTQPKAPPSESDGFTGFRSSEEVNWVTPPATEVSLPGGKAIMTRQSPHSMLIYPTAPTNRRGERLIVSVSSVGGSTFLLFSFSLIVTFQELMAFYTLWNPL